MKTFFIFIARKSRGGVDGGLNVILGNRTKFNVVFSCFIIKSNY